MRKTIKTIQHLFASAALLLTITVVGCKKDEVVKSTEMTDEQKLVVVKQTLTTSKIFDNTDFGYAQITVNRALKDEKGNIIKDNKGIPKADPKLKDTENIPLKDDIQEFFEREVLPFAPDAWWDKKDTKIGYEINFAKYFYKHNPPRSLSEIAKDIFSIEKETDGLLKEIIES